MRPGKDLLMVLQQPSPNSPTSLQPRDSELKPCEHVRTRRSVASRGGDFLVSTTSLASWRSCSRFRSYTVYYQCSLQRITKATQKRARVLKFTYVQSYTCTTIGNSFLSAYSSTVSVTQQLPVHYKIISSGKTTRTYTQWPYLYVASSSALHRFYFFAADLQVIGLTMPFQCTCHIKQCWTC